jgi:uncharacterized protein
MDLQQQTLAWFHRGCCVELRDFLEQCNGNAEYADASKRGLKRILKTSNKLTEATIITQTTNWIKSVVIGCNFCPFAAKAMQLKSIRYVVLPDATLESGLDAFLEELRFLDGTETIETTLLIFSNNFADFEEYLDLVTLAEHLLRDHNYEGVYQVASFHPEYCFEGAPEDDPANYTNRSMYPMLHLLREESITKAIAFFPDPEGIPQRNIDFARQKGLRHMQLLRAACLE